MPEQKKSKAEEELDKLLAEARATEAKLVAKNNGEPGKPEHSGEQEPQNKPKERFDALSLFFISLAIAALVGGSIVFLRNMQMHHPIEPPQLSTGLAVYAPTDLLEDWQLVDARTSLADIRSDLRAKWLAQGVEDAAMWHYRKDRQDLYVWLRVYPNKEALEKYDVDFMSPFVWATTTYLSFGENGRVGVYRSPSDPNPLLLYVSKNSTMLYLAYYNQDGRYNSTNKSADQLFLINLGKELFNKVGNSG